MENCNMSAEDIRLFLKGEYIKRHFEQESPDVDWLKDHWDEPLSKHGITIESLYLRSLFVTDILQLYHKKCHSQQYSSFFIEPDENGVSWLAEMEYIILSEKVWLKKMYDISCQYGLCAAELMIPYDIEAHITHYKDQDELPCPIPNFLEHTAREGFLGIRLNFDSISILINETAEQYDINKILQYIGENLTQLRLKKGITLSEDEEKILQNMPRGEDGEKSNKNSDMTKLMGLLQWDLRLQGIDLNKIKEKCRKIGEYNCPKESTSCSSCKSKDSCKGAFTTQLYNASASIQVGDHTSVQKGKKPSYTHKGREIKIHRVRYPRQSRGLEVVSRSKRLEFTA